MKRFFVFIVLAVLNTATYSIDYTVSKDGLQNFTTIQEAVDSCSSGNDRIIVTDGETYNERVEIIDKTGIMITSSTYTGKATQTDYSAFPVILWYDVENTHPESEEELATMADNFLTNGTISVQNSKHITISGFTISGEDEHGKSFYNPYVYDGRWPLEHGNTAVSIYKSKHVVVRGCEVKNTFFGFFISGAVHGGAYATGIEADDKAYTTIPLSNIGSTGGHIIERNKVYNNSYAFGLKSTWGSASTIQYNMIYNNYGTKSSLHEDTQHYEGGVFFVEDHANQPLIFHGNSMYDNHIIISHRYWRHSSNMVLSNNIMGEGAAQHGLISNSISMTDQLLDEQTNIFNNIFQPTETPSGNSMFISEVGLSSDDLDPPFYILYGVDINYDYHSGSDLEWDSVLVEKPTIKNRTILSDDPLFDSRITTLHTNENLQGYNNSIFVTDFYNGTEIETHRKLFTSVKSTDNNFLEPNLSDEWLSSLIETNVPVMVKTYDLDQNPSKVGALFTYEGELCWSGQNAYEKMYVNDGAFAPIIDKSATINFSLTLEQGKLDNIDATSIRIVSLYYFDDIKQIAPFDDWETEEKTGIAKDITNNIKESSISFGENTITVGMADIQSNTLGSFHMTIEAENLNGEKVVSNVAHFSTRNFIYTYGLDSTISTLGTVSYSYSFDKKPLTSDIEIVFEDESGAIVTKVNKGEKVYVSLSSSTSCAAGKLALSSNNGVLYNEKGVEIKKWVDDSGIEVAFNSQGRIPVIFNDAGYHVITAAGLMSDSSMVIGVSIPFAVQGEYDLSVEPMKEFSKDGYGIVIAPNPIKEEAAIYVSSKNRKADITIFTKFGTLVKSFTFNGVSEKSIPLSKEFISTLGEGQYYSLLTVDGEKMAGKWFYKTK